jgi:hypothetical protein
LETPFLRAARRGDVTMLKLLRKHGTDVHAKDKVGDEAHTRLACPGCSLH